MPAARARSGLAPREAVLAVACPVSWLGLAAALACAALACQSPGAPAEPASCLDERQEARNLALRGEVEAAQAVLDRVKASCGANSQSDIQHITKLIAEKTAARVEKERLAQIVTEELEKFPSRGFVAWATERGGEIAGKLSQVECAERGEPTFGFCQGSRDDAPTMSLRYFQARPSAYRYALRTSTPPSCQDLAEFRQVRTWTRSTERFELCELTNRRLRHLSALIVTHDGAPPPAVAPSGTEPPAITQPAVTPPAGKPAPEYEMYVFSQDYLALDPAFERRLSILGDAL
jgi:hypothetical protein